MRNIIRMTEWGNFWITCLTCGNKRHTGTDFNARLIKEAHEHNHIGHMCEIKNEKM